MHLRLQDWITLIASSAGFALAVLVLWRGRRSPMALPLALLSIDFCCFNLATMFYELSGQQVAAFNILDKGTSPFAIALGLHFVLAFVGQRKALAPVLGCSYLVAALIALPALLSPWFPWAARFIDTRNDPQAGWSLANIAHLSIVFLLGMALNLRHYRRSRGAEERERTLIVITAVAVLTLGGGSELLPGVQGAAPVASTLFTLLLSAVTLRLSLFDARVAAKFVPVASLAGLSAVAGLLALFAGWKQTAAVLLLAMFGLLISVVVGASRDRDHRLEELAIKGRAAANLAHNLKNPLAALKGAAQFLRFELGQGKSIRAEEELIDLLLEQIQRLETALEHYQRLGKVEAVPVRLDVNEVVKRALALQSYQHAAVKLRLDVDETLPSCRGDPQLLEQALDNLVRNAFEAMPDGGEVNVSTQRGIAEIVITVTDNGVGMTPRTLELARQEFYTTKPSGSGLGLAFVQRVADAHRGRLRISSREGEGTTVRLSLPA